MIKDIDKETEQELLKEIKREVQKSIVRLDIAARANNQKSVMDDEKDITIRSKIGESLKTKQEENFKFLKAIQDKEKEFTK